MAIPEVTPGHDGDRRLGIAELERRISTHRATIWRWCVAGGFPPPHYIGARRFWWFSEVVAWEAGQASNKAPPMPGTPRVTP